MELLGAAHDVIALALPYSNFIFLVIPCTIFLQVLSSIIQGTGDTKTPMYALIAVNLLYLTIAYPLIYGLWGFPALGITGAAVAAGLAEGTGVAYLLWSCRSLLKKSLHITARSLTLHLANWRIGLRRTDLSAGRDYSLHQDRPALRHGDVRRPSSRLIDRIPVVPSGIWLRDRSRHDGGTEYRRREICPGKIGKLGSESPGRYRDGFNGRAVLFLSLRAAPHLYQRRGCR